MDWPERSPTIEECEANAVIARDDATVIFAAWHPQWGGYVGKCWVRTSVGDASHCFDVRNYHDGEFPRDYEFKETHYCAAEQLRRFADLIGRMQSEEPQP